MKCNDVQSERSDVAAKPSVNVCATSNVTTTTPPTTTTTTTIKVIYDSSDHQSWSLAARGAAVVATRYDVTGNDPVLSTTLTRLVSQSTLASNS